MLCGWIIFCALLGLVWCLIFVVVVFFNIHNLHTHNIASTWKAYKETTCLLQELCRRRRNLTAACGPSRPVWFMRQHLSFQIALAFLTALSHLAVEAFFQICQIRSLQGGRQSLKANRGWLCVHTWVGVRVFERARRGNVLWRAVLPACGHLGLGSFSYKRTRVSTVCLLLIFICFAFTEMILWFVIRHPIGCNLWEGSLSVDSCVPRLGIELLMFVVSPVILARQSRNSGFFMVARNCSIFIQSHTHHLSWLASESLTAASILFACRAWAGSRCTSPSLRREFYWAGYSVLSNLCGRLVFSHPLYLSHTECRRHAAWHNVFSVALSLLLVAPSWQMWQRSKLVTSFVWEGWLEGKGGEREGFYCKMDLHWSESNWFDVVWMRSLQHLLMISVFLLK